MSRKKVKMFVFLTECKHRAVWTKVISLDIDKENGEKKRKKRKNQHRNSIYLAKKILT